MTATVAAREATDTAKADPTPQNKQAARAAIEEHENAYTRWVGTREGQSWAKQQQAKAAAAGDTVKAAIIRQHATAAAAKPHQSVQKQAPTGQEPQRRQPARIGTTRPAVRLHPVKSEAIRAIGYDKETGRCEVEMHSRPGRPYAYRMSSTQYRKFRAAPSLGAYFAQHVARNPDLAYPDTGSWQEDAVHRRCSRCGQWAGSSHVCDTPGTEKPSTSSSPGRTDRTDKATIRTPDGLDRAAWHGRVTIGQFTVPVDATTTDDDGTQHQVTGILTGTYQDGQWDVTAGAGELTCSCDTDGCAHRAQVTDAVAQTVNPTRPPAGAAKARSTARDAAALEHYRAEERHETLPDREPAEVMYSNDMDTFNEDIAAARARSAAGGPPVEYMRENALGGLSDRDGGRGFGVELEFGFPDEWDEDRKDAARDAIAADLHAQGLTPDKHVHGWEEDRDSYPDQHERGWSFMTDASCEGEVVSPVMYDEPETWSTLEKVCDTIKRHGGTESRWAGGHVHVSTFDYDHTVENHSRLTQIWRDNQDTMFRLGSTPGRTHRGFGYCMPNRMPSEGFQTWQELEGRTGDDEDRHVPVNLAPTVRPDTQNGHVEFRAWDGSLEPGIIQARIKLSVAMTDTAFRDRDYTSSGPEPVGMHAAQSQPDEDQTPQQWASTTRSVRRAADLLFTRREDKAQVASLFAATSWVDPRKTAAAW